MDVDEVDYGNTEREKDEREDLRVQAARQRRERLAEATTNGSESEETDAYGKLKL